MENGEEIAYDFNLQVGESVERGDYSMAENFFESFIEFW
jgi:hypothetical protein